MKRVLRSRAEKRIPDTADPWPAIRERATARDHRSPGMARPFPKTRAGWVFAAVMVVFLGGTGAYAASDFAGGLFRSELPADDNAALGQSIAQEQTADKARVTLEWAYADEQVVVVGLDVSDLAADQGTAEDAAQLEPVPFSEDDARSLGLPPGLKLTDGSGAEFREIDGTSLTSLDPEQATGPTAQTAVFETPEGFDPSGAHRFRLEVNLLKGPIVAPSRAGEPLDRDPSTGPYAFGFAVPVRPVPVVEVGEKATAGGTTLTLQRVENSPGRPQAVVCVQPPDAAHQWRPVLADDGASIDPRPLANNCWSAVLGDRVSGPSSVTVTELRGIPMTPEAAGTTEDWKTVEGPWTFDFVAPGL